MPSYPCINRQVLSKAQCDMQNARREVKYADEWYREFQGRLPARA